MNILNKQINKNIFVKVAHQGKKVLCDQKSNPKIEFPPTFSKKEN